MAVDGQLWYVTNGGNGTTDERVVDATYDSGGTVTQTTVMDNSNAAFGGTLRDIGLDMARGFYFALTYSNSGTPTDTSDDQLAIVRGSTTGGAVAIAFDVDQYAPTLGTDASILSMSVDAASHKIYVGVLDFNGSTTPPDATDEGVFVFNYDDGGNISPQGWLFTAQSVGKAAVGGRTYFSPQDTDLDLVNNQLYVVDRTTATAYRNQTLYRYDLVTHQLVAAVDPTQFPADPSTNFTNGILGEVEVDATRGHVFFSTYGLSTYENSDGSLNASYNAALNQIWMVPTGSVNAHATALTLSGAPAGFRPERLAFDERTNQLYVEFEGAKGAGTNSDLDDAILVFQVNDAGTAATLIQTITPATPTTTAGNFNVDALTFNDLPQLVASAAQGIVEGGAAANVFANGATITEADRGDLLGATIQITQNLTAGDVLSITAGSGITASSYNAASGTISLTGRASLAAYQTAIASLQYRTTADNPTGITQASPSDTTPTRTVTVTLNDGSPNVASGSANTTSTTFTVTPVNDAPTIANVTGDSVAYTANAAAVAIDVGANGTITDPDSPNFNTGSLTVAVTNAQTGDRLGLTESGGFTVSGTTLSYNSTAIATISGRDSTTEAFTFTSNTATPAVVQQLLHQLTFASSSTVSGTNTRTIAYTLVDGDGTANGGAATGTASSSVVVTVPNQAPTNTAAAARTVAENSGAVALSGFSVADANTNDTLTVTLSATHGTIALASTTGLTFTGGTNGTDATLDATLSFTGTRANIGAALTTVTFTQVADYNGTATVAISTSDGTATSTTATTTLTITAVNDAPTAAITDFGGATEQVSLSLKGHLSVADVDAGTAVVTATVSADYGILHLAVGTSGATIVSGNDTGSVQVSGTLAQLNALFGSDGTSAITYTANTDTPPASATLTLSVNDGGNTGSGGALISTATHAIAIQAVDDASVAVADAAATVDTAVATGNVVSNDHDVDGPALTLASASYHGTALVLGQATALANGAILTVNADGTYSYDPHGAFQYLASPSSGADASQTTATDTFSYTLTGPAVTPETKTASVTITITGADNDDAITQSLAGGRTINAGNGNNTVTITDATGTNTVTTGSGNDHITVTATSGTDTINAGDGNNVVTAQVAQGGIATFVINAEAGNDTLYGGSGDDTLSPGLGTNIVDGGAGNDTGVLQGRYADYTITRIDATTIQFVSADGTENDRFSNVEQYRFADGTVLALGAAGADSFDVSGKTGSITLATGDGNDAIFAGATLTGADRIDGGAGTNDQVGISGDYTGTHALVLQNGTLTNVEVLAALPGHSYSITSADHSVADGQTLTVYGSNLGAGDSFTFDGSAETTGSFMLYGGNGTDTLTGGANADAFYFGPDKFGSNDVVHGGGGIDQLGLDGHTAALTLDATHTDVEVLALLKGPAGFAPDTYGTITVDDSWVAAGETKTITAVTSFHSSIGPVTTDLVIDGHQETNGNLNIYGGSGNDTITGGSGNDTIFGGLGHDTLTGGAGADIFVYNSAAESTSTGYDTLTDFTAGQDVIQFNGQVHDNYKDVVGGQLNDATFDQDLSNAVGTSLTNGAAVFFTATSGDHQGQTLLIVDVNGSDGYQAGQDLVMLVPTPSHPPI